MFLGHLTYRLLVLRSHLTYLLLVLSGHLLDLSLVLSLDLPAMCLAVVKLLLEGDDVVSAVGSFFFIWAP